MTLDCPMCGKDSVLSNSEVARIVAQLSLLEVGGSHIWNCSCRRYQIVLRLTIKPPKWNLVEAAKGVG
jgi:hypothetical protein